MGLAHGIAVQLRAESWPSVLPSIIDATERDFEIARAALLSGTVVR